MQTVNLYALIPTWFYTLLIGYLIGVFTTKFIYKIKWDW